MDYDVVYPSVSMTEDWVRVAVATLSTPTRSLFPAGALLSEVPVVL